MDDGLGELLAREARHRVANELAVAAAAVRLAMRDGASAPALTAAAERLEAAAEVNALLCREPTGGAVDLAAELAQLRRPLERLAAAAGWTVRFAIAPATVADAVASRIAMIVFELVSNSLRHGDGADGRAIALRLCDVGGVTTLSVRDGGRPRAWTRPGGQGGRIVDALAASLGGIVYRGEAFDGAGVDVFMPSLAFAPVLGASRAAPPGFRDHSVHMGLGR